MTRHEPLIIVAIIIGFLILGLIYSVTTPIFEALDEVWHFAVIHHIVHQRYLPVQPEEPADTGLWRQQGSQPPLYYLLGSLFVAPINTADFTSLVQYNPYASGGHPEVAGNKNILLHWPDREGFPYQGVALAVHVLRLYSLTLGAATVYGVYRIGRHIWPEQIAFASVAAAFVAFNPQFVFVHAGVINDALAIALSTWVLERLIWLVGEERPLAIARWSSWAFIGLGIGTATLSKLSGAFLLPLAGIAIIWLAWKERAWRHALLHLTILSSAILLVSGWWFLRNWRLYEDPTGLNRFIVVAGARTREFGVWDFCKELSGLELSYWAVFGWFSILADPTVYAFFKVLDRLALLGLAWWVWRLVRRHAFIERTTLARLGLLTAWLVLLTGGLYQWTTRVMGTQGRLLFPGAASIAIGLVLGLGAWLPEHWRERGLSLTATALALIALVAPFRYIAPSYRRPQIMTKELAQVEESIPERIHLQYGDWAELVGYALDRPTAQPKGSLALTLYWRALTPVSQAYDLYIHLRDAEGRMLGQLDTYPGWGIYPTFLWKPDQIIVDRYRVPITIAPEQPLIGRIEVGFCCDTAGAPFTAYDPQGRLVTPAIGRFKVEGTKAAEPLPPVSAPRFGEKIALAAYDLESEGEQVTEDQVCTVRQGATLAITLEWAPLGQIDTDYTIFVHLVSDTLIPLAQSDGEPQQGRYPTSFWQVGERIREVRTLIIPDGLPSGDYRLLIGLYRQSDGKRLPLQNLTGEASGDAYQLPIKLRVQSNATSGRD